MNNFRHTVLASVIHLTLLGMTDVSAADSVAMEKRIHELESRLEKMDQLEKRLAKMDLLEKRLEKLDRLEAMSVKSEPVPIAPQVINVSPEVAKLKTKVNILERKLEVQEEVNTAAFKKLPIFDGGENGFKITSSDKKHQLRIGSAIQTDYRNFLGDNPSAWIPGSSTSTTPGPAGWLGGVGPDSIFLRQARIILEGYVFNDIYFKLMPDFAQTSNTSNLIPDAFVDFAYEKKASLLVGKYKPSIGLERLQGDVNTVFLERAFPTNLAPNRDMGLQLHGAFAKPGYSAEKVVGAIDSKNAFTYQVGITNGTGDSGNIAMNGALPNTSSQFANNKEFDGRIFAQPFQHSGYDWLEGFGIGVSGSFSNPDHLALSAQRTPLGQSQFVDYTSLNGQAAGSVGNYASSSRIITSNGNANRIYPQAFWYSGPFGLMGEYVRSTQTLNASGSSATGGSKVNNITQTNTASQVQLSYVVTGEDNQFEGVKPIRNFDPEKGTWGALQLAGRWSELDVDNDTFKLLDPTKTASKATALTVGANWFLNKYSLIRFDYENVFFTGGAGTTTGSGVNAVSHIANRPNEQLLSTRFQLAF